jgi:putative transposase
LARSTFHYKPQPRTDEALLARIREIALTRVRYGYWRIYTLLRREGWPVNHKRVYRLYKLEGLNLRSKRPRRNRAAAHRLERIEETRPHQAWSMDFVADALFDGRRFRALTVVDNFSRQCLAIHVDASIGGQDVVEIINRIRARHGAVPERIQVDNGSEFISKALDRWAYEHAVTLDFSRPGKPTDNPSIESFNGSLRDECLNVHWFLSLDDARTKIEVWRRDYNAYRPHQSLGGLSPEMYLNQYLETTAESLLLAG